MNPEGQTCATCLSYDPKPGQDTGRCRYLPPVRIDSTSAAFPPTHKDNWCCQWTTATPAQLQERTQLAVKPVPPPQNFLPRWSYPQTLVELPAPKSTPKPTHEEPLVIDGRPIRNFGVAKPA